MPKKIIEQRRCIACRKVQSKFSMLRIARAPNGEVNIDLTGKAPGHGAYICKSESCLKLARKKNAFNRALKIQVKDEFYDILDKHIAKLMPSERIF